MGKIRWVKNIRAATAVEYGILIAGIATALIAIIFSMGDDLLVIFNKLVAKITSVL